MEIKTTKDGDKLTVAVIGRIVTPTAPQLERELQQNIDGVANLVFDFSELEYISSAGLRVLAHADKVMSKQGDMVIKHPNEDVMEVFEITGLVDLLTIEE